MNDHLLNLRNHLRARPGMYFGCAGIVAIPRLLTEVALALSQRGIRPRPVSLDICFQKGVIRLRLQGAGCRALSPANTTHWLDERTKDGAAIAQLIAASERCVVRVSTNRARWEFHISDQRGCWSRRLAGTGPSEISLEARLHRASFGRIDSQNFHRLAGSLRDLSILRPNLTTRLRITDPAVRFEWCYPEGMKSFLAEMDHSRWPLHPDCLYFVDEQEGIRVEAYLRFVHAGVPDVRSWVNFHPSHGGVHLEGLGKALTKLFPDADAGCRRVLFITNPDTGARVMLPHPFVALLHLQLRDPRFAGPTKDILLGDHVRDFVYQTAKVVLQKQWKELRARRP